MLWKVASVIVALIDLSGSRRLRKLTEVTNSKNTREQR